MGDTILKTISKVGACLSIDVEGNLTANDAVVFNLGCCLDARCTVLLTSPLVPAQQAHVGTHPSMISLWRVKDVM